MTNEELQAHIQAIESAVKRGEVEHATNGGNFYKTQWLPVGKFGVVARIKPQPREVWLAAESLNARPDECVTAWPKPDDRGYTWVKFREVLE